MTADLVKQIEQIASEFADNTDKTRVAVPLGVIRDALTALQAQAEPVAWLRTEKRWHEDREPRRDVTLDAEVAEAWRLSWRTATVEPLYASPVPDETAVLRERVEKLEAALAVAAEQFDDIRLILVGNLDEPERTAFWEAVKARDAARATLTELKEDRT